MFRLELLYRHVLTTLPEPESSPKLERYKNTQTKSWHGTFFIWTHDDKKKNMNLKLAGHLAQNSHRQKHALLKCGPKASNQTSPEFCFNTDITVQCSRYKVQATLIGVAILGQREGYQCSAEWLAIAVSCMHRIQPFCEAEIPSSMMMAISRYIMLSVHLYSLYSL